MNDIETKDGYGCEGKDIFKGRKCNKSFNAKILIGQLARSNHRLVHKIDKERNNAS